MKRLHRRVRTALAAALLWLWPMAVMAQQQWEKVEGKAADEIPAVPFIGYAYGFIWVAVLGYVLYLARGLSQVSAQIAELRRKLDGSGPGPREADRR